MIKHRFLVVAINSEGKMVSSSYVGVDMVQVILEYRKLGCNPHSIIQAERVHPDTQIGIERYFQPPGSPA